VFVGALEMDVQIPGIGSLKAKRSVVRHILDAARQRYGVAASEVGFQDKWQRSGLGFCTVAPTAGRVEEVLDTVERFVWSHPEVTVLACTRRWLDQDD
jgi:uncharacterized protein YlxP (DUF503 family)